MGAGDGAESGGRANEWPVAALGAAVYRRKRSTRGACQRQSQWSDPCSAAQLQDNEGVGGGERGGGDGVVRLGGTLQSRGRKDLALESGNERSDPIRSR